MHIGSGTGGLTSNSYSTVMIGNYAGHKNIGGWGLVFVGHGAGSQSTSSFNTFLGQTAGEGNTTGQKILLSV